MLSPLSSSPKNRQLAVAVGRRRLLVGPPSVVVGDKKCPKWCQNFQIVSSQPPIFKSKNIFFKKKTSSRLNKPKQWLLPLSPISPTGCWFGLRFSLEPFFLNISLLTTSNLQSKPRLRNPEKKITLALCIFFWFFSYVIAVVSLPRGGVFSGVRQDEGEGLRVQDRKSVV